MPMRIIFYALCRFINNIDSRVIRGIINKKKLVTIQAVS